MNYKIFLATGSRPFLANFFMDANLRPHLRDVVKIRGVVGNYIVTKIEVATLAYGLLREDGGHLLTESGEPIYLEELDLDKVTLNYFVQRPDTSPDTITLGGDTRRFMRAMQRIGRPGSRRH